MFKVGEIIPINGPKGAEHYIVVESGDKPQLELIEDFIMRNYTVVDHETGGVYTIKQLVNREKQKMINKGQVNV